MRKVVEIAGIFLLVCVFAATPRLAWAQQCTVEAYFSPYDNVEDVIVKRLVEAKRSVNCSLYGITNARITAILIALQQNDTTVSLCLDKNPERWQE